MYSTSKSFNLRRTKCVGVITVVHRFVIITPIAIQGIFHCYKCRSTFNTNRADLLQIGAKQLLMSYLRKTNELI